MLNKVFSSQRPKVQKQKYASDKNVAIEEWSQKKKKRRSKMNIRDKVGVTTIDKKMEE